MITEMYRARTHGTHLGIAKILNIVANKHVRAMQNFAKDGKSKQAEKLGQKTIVDVVATATSAPLAMKTQGTWRALWLV